MSHTQTSRVWWENRGGEEICDPEFQPECERLDQGSGRRIQGGIRHWHCCPIVRGAREGMALAGEGVLEAEQGSTGGRGRGGGGGCGQSAGTEARWSRGQVVVRTTEFTGPEGAFQSEVHTASQRDAVSWLGLRRGQGGVRKGLGGPRSESREWAGRKQG